MKSSDGRAHEKALAIDLPHAHTALYRDFTSGAVQGEIPAFRTPPAWNSLARRRLAECGATGDMWREIEAINRRAGAHDKALDRLRCLAAGECVAVVGGQQPGFLGGPLLVLYKAATAVAVAERFESATGVPCAPIFIVSSDDSDYAEIRECTVYDRWLRRLTLSFSDGAHRPGEMVGALSHREEGVLAGSLASSLGGAPHGKYVEDLLASAAGAAGDHGEFVCALLAGTFSDKGMIVIDGRSAGMRRAGAHVFRLYLERRAELRESVEAAGADLGRRGYHAQLGAEGLESWLFAVEGKVRKKIEGRDLSYAKRAVDDSPEALSPNVALRPLWRDYVLPTVFCICGPSEIAYSWQLREAYRILEMSQPGLFPRLGATLVPPEGEAVAGGWTEPGIAALVSDPETALGAHYRSRIPKEVLRALESAKATVDGGLAELADSLTDLSEEWRSVGEAVRRSSASALVKLEEDLADSIRREAQRDNARLKGISDFIAPGRKLQERALSLLYPLLEEGAEFIERAVSMTSSFVLECEGGRVPHFCHRLPDAPTEG